MATVALAVLGSRQRKGPSPVKLLTVLAGVFGGVATIWPIALAPFFFGASGEIMLATLPISLLGLPFAIWFWISVFRKL